MTAAEPLPFVHSIFHPSDFSKASETAFAHALAIALLRRADLTLLHAGAEPLAEDEWTKFPPVRRTLARWGLLEPNSPRSAIFEEFAVRVRKVSVTGRHPAEAVVDYLADAEPDLVVLATDAREGPPRWLRPSRAEAIARRSRTLTLFVPNGSRGFVCPEDGTTTLQRILVPLDHRPRPHAAVSYAARAAHALGDPPVQIRLVHVGTDAMPRPDLPQGDGWSWQQESRQGEAVTEILAAAADLDVDLVVMATQGRQGLLDALRGSVTERVLRRGGRPLLAVPET